MGAVTQHATATRNAIANAVATAANAGAAAPKIFIGTSSLALPSTGVLASGNLGGDFGSASGGVVSASPPGSPLTAGAGGTAALAIIADSNNTEIYRGAVTTDATGIVQLNTLTIANGDLITISGNVTYTAPT